jgi:hypothetical protein
MPRARQLLFASLLASFTATFASDHVVARQLTVRGSRGPETTELTERLDRYKPGATAVPPMTVDVLRSGAADFRRGATAWIDAGELRDQPRRRLIVAAYVLDILKEFEDRRLWTSTQPAEGLLEWGCATLRKSDIATRAESAWHTAALALVERSGPTDVIQKHLDHAQARFPADDHWLLVRVLVDELEADAGRRDDGTLSISGGARTRATQHFQVAAARPATRQEALIRWAAFDSDRGDQEAALKHLVDAGPLSSDVLQYWGGVIRGRALERAKHIPEAIDAYRSVVAQFPGAQTARLSLAAALVDAHRVLEASTIVSSAVAFTDATPGPDPWDFYRSPDVLLWSWAFEQLRRETAR